MSSLNTPGRSPPKHLVVTLCLVLLCSVGTTTVPAATITVTTNADDGPGSLRAALASSGDGDVINFSLATPAIITLITGELLITNSVTILGPGAGNLTINGNQQWRVFHIPGPSDVVTIAGLTIRNGVASGGYPGGGGGGILNAHSLLTVSDCILAGNAATSGGGGGGIFNVGINDAYGSGTATLVVFNSTLTNNTSSSGGGIFNFGQSGSAIVTLVNSTLSGNQGGGSGGGIASDGSSSGSATVNMSGSTMSNNLAFNGAGIYNNGMVSGNANLNVTNSAISGNIASQYGGAIYNNAQFGTGAVTVVRCTLNGNSVTFLGFPFKGGGIYNIGLSGRALLTVSESTISSNAAPDGGAIYNEGGSGNATLAVNNSTISGNVATNGGAIYNNAAGGAGSIATVSIANSTLSGNAARLGGGIISLGGNAATVSVEIGNTILKAGSSGVNLTNNTGTIITRGYNLSSDNGGGFLTNATDQINTDPLLGGLQNNGGPTFTHALLAGSPAIDQGKRDAVPTLASTNDQRGSPRPLDFAGINNVLGGDGSDIGAFESQASAVASIPIHLSAPQKLSNGTFQFSFTNTPGASFTVLNSTNVALPLNNWTTLGAPTEIAPGQFQFTDAQATNRARSFYRVISP